MTALLENSLSCHNLFDDQFYVLLRENVGLQFFVDGLCTINANWLFEKLQLLYLLEWGNFINLVTVVDLVFCLNFWMSENVNLAILSVFGVYQILSHTLILYILAIKLFVPFFEHFFSFPVLFHLPQLFLDELFLEGVWGGCL